jgi:hypothetical protein
MWKTYHFYTLLLIFSWWLKSSCQTLNQFSVRQHVHSIKYGTPGCFICVKFIIFPYYWFTFDMTISIITKRLVTRCSLVSCIPNVISFSELSTLDCPSVFSDVYLQIVMWAFGNSRKWFYIFSNVLRIFS